MKCFLKYIIYFSPLISPIFTPAQNQTKIDSLENLLKTDKEDTNKVNILNTLAWNHKQNNTDTAIYYSKQALDIAKKTEWKKGIASSYHNLGVFNYFKGNYHPALDYYNNALKIKEQLNNKKGIASTLGNIGIIYRTQGKYPEALEYYFKALKIDKELGNKNGIARCLGNIGIVYFNQGDYPKALEYYFKALKMDEELGNTNGVARHLDNIGSVYHNQGDYPKALEYYFKALKMKEKLGNKREITSTLGNIGNVYMNQDDYPKALKYYFKTLKMAEELGNKYFIASILGNIGLVYWKQGSLSIDDSVRQENYSIALEYYFKSLKIGEEFGDKNGIAIDLGNIGLVYSDQNDYPKALKYYFKALKMAEELGNKNSIAAILGNIGLLYTKQKKHKEAEFYLLQALELSTEIGVLSLTKSQHQKLSDLYERTNKPTKALEHYKLYTNAKNSLYNEEKSKEIGKLEATAEYDKQLALQQAEQEKKEAVAEAESRRQKVIIWAVSGGLLLLAIFAFFVVNRLRITKRQKVIIEEQKKLVDEKNKDITDSIRYAQNIQEAILPQEAEIKKALPDHFIYFQPKDIVSGDFYWFTRTNGNIFIAACDCTGHGVPGAFVSMIGNDLLNQIIIEKGLENPGKILTNLNNGIKSVFTREGFDQQAQDGMDMALCVFDKNLKTLEFAGAKNPLLVIQNGELKQIKWDINPIGGVTEKDYQFTNHKIELQKGNTIYIFSDGYQDQFGGQRDRKFMIKRFKELLLSIQDNEMQEQKKILHKTIIDWRGDTPQVDDICVIGIRV